MLVRQKEGRERAVKGTAAQPWLQDMSQRHGAQEQGTWTQAHGMRALPVAVGSLKRPASGLKMRLLDAVDQFMTWAVGVEVPLLAAAGIYVRLGRPVKTVSPVRGLGSCSHQQGWGLPWHQRRFEAGSEPLQTFRFSSI